jgi:hypothetical protein
VETETIYLAQFVYDLAQATSSWGTRQAPAACTVGCHGPFFVRYLDWCAPEGIGVFTELQDREAWGRGYKAVGFPGFFGLVTALSPTLCFAMNQVPCGKTDWTGVPATYYARLFYERVLRNMQGKPDRLLGAVNRVCKGRLKSEAGGAGWRGGRKVRHLRTTNGGCLAIWSNGARYDAGCWLMGSAAGRSCERRDCTGRR